MLIKRPATVFQYLCDEFSDAIVDNCCDSGCKLDLRGLDNVVVLKGEKIFPDRPVCDCIIFSGEETIVAGVVELKSKTVDVSKVKEQLRGGLRFVKEALERSKTKRFLKNCIVVLMAKKWRTHEHRLLTARKISFDGKNLLIIPKKCGDRLIDILNCNSK